jgi:hypothetical protein
MTGQYFSFGAASEKQKKVYVCNSCTQLATKWYTKSIHLWNIFCRFDELLSVECCPGNGLSCDCTGIIKAEEECSFKEDIATWKGAL